MTDTTPTKRCCTCKAHKPLYAFGRNRSLADGLMAQCRECRAAAMRRYRAKYPTAATANRAQSAAWRAATTALRDNHRAEFDRLYAQAKNAQNGDTPS